KAVTSGAYTKLPEWIETGVMDGDIVTIRVETAEGETSKGGLNADTEGPPAFKRVCKQIEAFAEEAVEKADLSAGTPLFEFIGEQGLTFAENFESGFPVSVSVVWDSFSGGTPITSTDENVIRSVFHALSEIRVMRKNGGMHTDDELRYWFTMTDGSSFVCTFQEGKLIFDMGALYEITGFGAVTQALRYEPPEPEPSLYPEGFGQQALEEAALLDERLKLIQPLVCPGSAVDDFFDKSADTFHYINTDGFSETAAWYENILPGLFEGYQTETDKGWRRYNGIFEGNSLTVILIGNASGPLKETSIAISFF
ncbi:MAG: hypothetical protein LBV08_07690, partial [Clostridiales bacterium]|nr:hypothetical protein [Clostridiales bacterium]